MRRSLTVVLAAASTVALAGCAALGIAPGQSTPVEPPPPNHANRIAAFLDPISTRGMDAAYLATYVVAPLDDPEFGPRIEVMSWEGNVSEFPGARLVIRVTDGEVDCSLFTVTDDNVAVEDRPCTDEPAPPLPSATMPPDVDNALVLAILERATAESVESDFARAFPGAMFSIDTLARGGELIAAVGIPARKDCVLAVKDAKGRVLEWGFDPIWIEPGELGCSTGLYASPPL